MNSRKSKDYLTSDKIISMLILLYDDTNLLYANVLLDYIILYYLLDFIMFFYDFTVSLLFIHVIQSFSNCIVKLRYSLSMISLVLIFLFHWVYFAFCFV